jgi:hypothetical protein
VLLSLVHLSVLFSSGSVLVACAKLYPAPARSSIRREPVPSIYYTAIEGYAEIKPEMLGWRDDAYVTSISAILQDERAEWRLVGDRAPWWVYGVVSTGTSSMTDIFLVDEQIVVGIEGVPGDERPSPGKISPIPIEEIIDSDEALRLARASGAVGDPIRIRITRVDLLTSREIPMSWLLVYATPGRAAVHVYVDALTGEVVRNEFTEQ